MKRPTLSLLILLLINLTVLAQSGTKDGNHEVSGITKLTIRIDAGMQIDIKPSQNDQLQYVYEFDGNKESYDHYFENFEPEFEKRGGEARFDIRFPDQTKKNTNYQIKKHSLSLEIPASVYLDVATRYSKLTLNGFSRGLSINNRSGLVKVENVKQTIVINNDYGAISLNGVQGEVMVSNRSANIDIKNVTGRVSVNAEYSKMNISKVNGDLQIDNRSGVLNAFDIQGNLTVNGPYTEYELTNIDGDIMMNNQSGKVVINTARSLQVSGDYTNIKAEHIKSDQGVEIEGRSANIDLSDIGGNVMISGQYLNIKLNKVQGGAYVQNRSASIDIDGLEDDLVINGEYLPTVVKNFMGENLEIVNRSGSINVEAKNKLKNIQIDSQYGKVELTMDKKFDGIVTLETKYGKTDTNMDLKNQTITREANEQVIHGTSGTPAGSMKIKNQNADIVVLQKK